MSQPVDPFVKLFQELQRPLSQERLNSYRTEVGNDREAIVKYYWNIELCEAMYPLLNMLEISLRNAIDFAATQQNSGNPYWFDIPGILLPTQRESVSTARAILGKDGYTITPGRITAQLHFGFWTFLLGPKYDFHLWRPKGYRLFRNAFPHMPRKIRARPTAYRRFNELRDVRNRVFHFEPIWNRTDLLQVHADILEAIGWISPPLKRSISILDRFPEVHEAGQVRVEQQLQRMLRTGRPRT